ncbi:hypothetical protein BGW41_000283 [Actinomortierella wolfii]|nr:hypothetical protein BGW41_000283 [Actinomortierella wolfii]
MPNKTALVLVADGTEEMEAVITIDVLVRAGIKVTVATIHPPTGSSTLAAAADATVHATLPTSASSFVTCSRGVRIVPDTHLASLSLTSDKFDVLVIPGGAPGAKAMAESSLVHQWVRAYFHDEPFKHQSLVAAICAGPTVLQAAGVAKGYKVTSHPSVRAQLEEFYKYEEGPNVVISGGAEEREQKLVTSRGPGTTFAFALTIAELLVGKEVADNVRRPMMMMHD